MLYWIPYAFIRITVSFIAGILAGIFLPDIIPEYLAVSIFLILLLVYFSLVILNTAKRKVIVNPGFAGLMAILIGGYINVLSETESRKENHFSRMNSISYYTATVVSELQEKERTWKQVLSVTAVKNDSVWSSSSGRIMLHYAKELYPKPFAYGDELLIKGEPSPISGPSNPGEFDYSAYLRYKNITAQHFIRDSRIVLTGSSAPNNFLAISYKMRLWANEKITQAVKGKQEQAIASALVLGVTDGLDHDLMNSYAATGAMHVLSVSGLHVGIVYLLIGFMLKPFSRLKNGKWIIALTGVSVLWIYACITGLSPSVLRAVTMFSFMAMAQPLNHRSNIFNTLAASAFCILFFDPFLIMSVGFQLSYLAVIGIVYLHAPLYNLYQPDSRIVDEIWKISCVSFAAQLATFSISIFYFHQFPNYFFLANLFVIPLGFVILVGGLALLAVSFAEPVFQFVGLALEWTIKILNQLIFLVESLPYSIIDNIQITAVQCWALMGMLIAVVLFFQFKNIRYWYATAAMMVVFIIASWQNRIHHDQSARLTVYKVAGSSAYDLFANGTAYFFADSMIEKSLVKFHILPNRLSSGVREVYSGDSQKWSRSIPGGQFTVWNGKTILQLSAPPPSLPEKLTVDILILSRNACKDIRGVLEKINANKIILDSSNSYFVADKALHSLPEHHRIHSVPHHGAFDVII